MTDSDCAVPGATLPFRRYLHDGQAYLEFDSSGSHCPVPMVNAMAGLEQSLAEGACLVMINGFEPEGLYERIQGHFQWRVEALGDGRVKVCFAPVEGRAGQVDFGNRKCQGG